MSVHRLGSLSWLGYRLPIAVPDERWLDWLTDFTGLEFEAGEAPASVPVLFVIDDRHVLVDGGDLRTFENLDDLKAWLFLTVSDVMVSRGAFTALHAAGFIAAGEAILVSGPPWAGKSSWALEARRRGFEVLGDDQVRVDPRTGVVHGLPRPLKRRLVEERVDRPGADDAVYACLDGERVALEPRGTTGFAAVERGYRVARIIHLTRHNGPGVDVRVLEKFGAVQSILSELRCYSATFLADVGASATNLGRLPNLSISVGDGQISRAMDRALAFP